MVRDAIRPDDVFKRSELIADLFLRSIPYRDHGCISFYHAMRHEVSTRLLLHQLNESGHQTALPVIVGKGQALAFREWTPGDPLKDGPFGTKEPCGDLVRPSLLVTPLVGFSRDGNRIGYGGGYYDRTLSALRQSGRALAVGLAFHEQERQDMGSEPHDERLDFIVTDREVISSRP